MIHIQFSNHFLFPWEQNLNVSPWLCEVLYNLPLTYMLSLTHPSKHTPFCSSNISGTFLPLRLCTCCALHLNSLLCDICMSCYFLTFNFSTTSSDWSFLTHSLKWPFSLSPTSPNFSPLPSSVKSIYTISLLIFFLIFFIFLTIRFPPPRTFLAQSKVSVHTHEVN